MEEFCENGEYKKTIGIGFALAEGINHELKKKRKLIRTARSVFHVALNCIYSIFNN
jgi:hypothetical protein